MKIAPPLVFDEQLINAHKIKAADWQFANSFTVSWTV